jgi:hypothetical protein
VGVSVDNPQPTLQGVVVLLTLHNLANLLLTLQVVQVSVDNLLLTLQVRVSVTAHSLPSREWEFCWTTSCLPSKCEFQWTAHSLPSRKWEFWTTFCLPSK